MAHQRKLIRDAVKTALTGATAAEDRVVNNRVTTWPVRLLELGPCLSIYAVTEQTNPDSKNTAPRKLYRDLELAIEGALIAGPGGDVDDLIDALCEEVEREMHRDPTFGQLCRDSILQSTDIEVESDGKTEVGNVRLVFGVNYTTLAPDPADVPLDDLLEAGIQYKLDPEMAEDNRATDELSFADPAVFLDYGATRPAEHADPQVLEFSVAELLDEGWELWIDAAASADEGVATEDHTITITHVATAALIKSTAVAPVAGRLLSGFDTADLTALADLTGHFVISVLDFNDLEVGALHFTLNA